MPIYKKRAVAENVLDLATQRLRLVYERFDRVFVSFSGGKDSTVCLQLALQVASEVGRLPLDVFFYDEEAIPPETVDYCARVARMPGIRFHWLCLPIEHRNACSRSSPTWHPWAPEDRDRWCRDLPANEFAPVTTLRRFHRHAMPECNGFLMGPEHGRVCTVQGIRTQESLNRYMAVANGKRGGEAFFSADRFKHVTKAYPIYDWASEDVWLAPHLLGWDYNRAYDLMQAVGVPVHLQRCAPPYGEQPIQRLWTYKVCWPELWAKMCYRVPGAATAARYSRTELYAHGDMSDLKQPTETWRDATYRWLMRHQGETRKTCARWINYLVALHRRNSPGNPLPDSEPDPLSGLSWKEISRVAMTGDTKGRKAPAIAAKVNGRVGKRGASRAAK